MWTTSTMRVTTVTTTTTTTTTTLLLFPSAPFDHLPWQSFPKIYLCRCGTSTIRTCRVHGNFMSSSWSAKLFIYAVPTFSELHWSKSVVVVYRSNQRDPCDRPVSYKCLPFYLQKVSKLKESRSTRLRIFQVPRQIKVRRNYHHLDSCEQK